VIGNELFSLKGLKFYRIGTRLLGDANHFQRRIDRAIMIYADFSDDECGVLVTNASVGDDKMVHFVFLIAVVPLLD
jgi:hypothetical protein